MTINKILFGVIGILFVSILGVGIFAFSNRSIDTAKPVVSENTFPQVNNEVPSDVVNTQPAVPSKKPGEYTIKEVAMHNSNKSCYTAVNGSVYDLTPFINQHPGGVEAISALCGIDGTVAFLAQHDRQRRPENELASLKIGVLVK